MGRHIVRGAKIAIVCLATISGVAMVLKLIAVSWWCGTLVALTCAYRPISGRDPWISVKGLENLSHRMEINQALIPAWVGPKQTISSAGLGYFGIALLLLLTALVDFSLEQHGILTRLAQLVGATSIHFQLLSVVIGTSMLFSSYEIMQAIRHHGFPTPQSPGDENR